MKKFLGIITIFTTIMMTFCLAGCSDSSSTDEGITANDYYKLLLNNNSSCRWISQVSVPTDFWTFERQSDGGVIATYSTEYTAGYIPNGFSGRVYLDFDPSATSYILDNWTFKIEGYDKDHISTTVMGDDNTCHYRANKVTSDSLPYINIAVCGRFAR